MVEVPEQDCRSVGSDTIWIQVVSSCVYCTAEPKCGRRASRSGIQWINHRSGSLVPRSDCIGGIPGYVEDASEWGVDLTMGFKLARIAVPTAEYG